jgi:hypothetical protein
MFIDQNASTHQLRSRSGSQRDFLPLRRIPLLRTEHLGPCLALYKHLTSDGVKTEDSRVRNKRVGPILVFFRQLARGLLNHVTLDQRTQEAPSLIAAISFSMRFGKALTRFKASSRVTRSLLGR